MQACEKIAQSVQVVFESMLSGIDSVASPFKDTFKGLPPCAKFVDCEFVQAAHVVLVRALSKILEPGGCARMVLDGGTRDVVMAAVSAVERFLLRAGRLGAAEVTSVKVLCVCV